MDASEDSPLSSLPPTDILIRAYWHCLGTTSNCTRQGKCKMKLKAEVRKDDPTFLYLYAGNSHEGETEPRILPWSRLLKEQARVHCIKYAGTTRSFMLRKSKPYVAFCIYQSLGHMRFDQLLMCVIDYFEIFIIYRFGKSN